MVAGVDVEVNVEAVAVTHVDVEVMSLAPTSSVASSDGGSGSAVVGAITGPWKQWCLDKHIAKPSK